MGVTFALAMLLILAGLYALVGGAAAVASYSPAKFGHLLVILGEFGGSVFLGALGGAAMAHDVWDGNPRRWPALPVSSALSEWAPGIRDTYPPTLNTRPGTKLQHS